MSTKKTAIAVLNGDTWEDTDPRNGGRRVVIEVAAAPMGQVKARDTTTGRVTRIAKDRLERESGWKLVSRKSEPSA